jgi:plastocyanin
MCSRLSSSLVRSPWRWTAALALVLSGIGAGAGACAPPPASHSVAIDALAFQPPALTVKAGDTIVWTNKDPFPHTITSQPGGFDSGSVQSGQSWSYVATQKGEFAYICTLHPTMKGALRVE